jgi:hypothetical protein
MSVNSTISIHVWDDAEWDPYLHPKGPDGKFVHGAGAAGSKKKPPKKDLMAEAKKLGIKVTSKTTVAQLLEALSKSKSKFDKPATEQGWLAEAHVLGSTAPLGRFTKHEMSSFVAARRSFLLSELSNSGVKVDPDISSKALVEKVAAAFKEFTAKCKSVGASPIGNLSQIAKAYDNKVKLNAQAAALGVPASQLKKPAQAVSAAIDKLELAKELSQHPEKLLGCIAGVLAIPKGNSKKWATVLAKKATLASIIHTLPQAQKIMSAGHTPASLANANTYIDHHTGKILKWNSVWTPATCVGPQRDAISDYTDGKYTKVNRYLRGDPADQNPGPTILKTVKYLDQVTRHASYSGTIYRGVPKDVFFKLYNAGLLVKGATVVDTGFMSFTKSKTFAKDWASGIIMEVEGGPGCADVSSLSQHRHEQEVIVARGAKMRVVSYDGPAKVLKLEIINHDEISAPIVHKKSTDDAANPELDDDFEAPRATPLCQRWESEGDILLCVDLDDVLDEAA